MTVLDTRTVTWHKTLTTVSDLGNPFQAHEPMAAIKSDFEPVHDSYFGILVRQAFPQCKRQSQGKATQVSISS